MIAYRAEIDGLRALAVVPIVLFHAGIDQLSGGYVGVDIFFVISGYLIGSIILGDLGAGRFSFRDFYLRRMRRILPALLFMVAATLVGGWFLLLPDEWMALARSSAATLFFVPNIHFWLGASTYFGLDIATQPLLHTWSLGVEEQFYLVVPALLVFLHARVRAIVLPAALLALCAASFWINVHWIDIDSRFSFYMLPARAFELLTGVLLAWWLRRVVPDAVCERRAGALLAAAGLALCIAPVFLLDEQSSFPGGNALYPVLGAALFILGTAMAPSCTAARLLAAPPFVFIGRISYSLYLWHWPVIVYLELARPAAANTLPAIALSVVLAILSWRFVEERYRRPSAGADRCSPGQLGQLGHVGRLGRLGRRRELQGLLAASVIACAVLLIADGFPQRVPEDAWRVAGNTAEGRDYGVCGILAGDPSLEAVRCRLGDPRVPATVALWGDSHANALAPALDTALHEAGQSGWLYFASGCRPLLDVSRPSRTRCPRFNAVVIDQIAADPALQTIYLAGYWRLPLMGQSYDDARFLIRDSASTETSPEENRRVFRRGLARTTAALDGRRVVLVEDVPEVGAQFGKALANHFVRRHWLDIDQPATLGFTRRRDDAYPRAFEALLAASFPELEVLRLQDRLCARTTCPLMLDGALLYHDGDHLSEAGSLHLASLFRPRVNPAAAAPRTR